MIFKKCVRNKLPLSNPPHMKPSTYAITLLFVLVSIIGFQHQAKAAGSVADPKLSPALSAEIDKLIQNKRLAGAVALVAQGGEIIHLQASGVRSLKDNQPMSTDTIFRIHSMTKAIVSVAALQQLERGKYQLSDPVSKYIPAFANLKVMSKNGKAVPATGVMTIEDLFRHTSGLAYGFTAPPSLVKQYGNPKLWSGGLEQFCDQLATIPLAHEPGESWTYGLGIDVLGRLIEIWSGQPLDQYLQKEIFDPLEMRDTGFWVDKADLPRFASVHTTTNKGVKSGNDPLGQKYIAKPKLISGGGGLTSTAIDYFNFLQMIANQGKSKGHTFLKPGTITMMNTNRLPKSIPNIFFGPEQRPGVGFGLGFSVVTQANTGWDDASRLGEFGWGGAASCHYWVSPNDNHLIVITLEQTAPYNWNMERALKTIIYKAIKK